MNNVGVCVCVFFFSAKPRRLTILVPTHASSIGHGLTSLLVLLVLQNPGSITSVPSFMPSMPFSTPGGMGTQRSPKSVRKVLTGQRQPLRSVPIGQGTTPVWSGFGIVPGDDREQTG